VSQSEAAAAGTSAEQAGPDADSVSKVPSAVWPQPRSVFRTLRILAGSLRSELPIREQGQEFLPRASSMYDLDGFVDWPSQAGYLDTIPTDNSTAPVLTAESGSGSVTTQVADADTAESGERNTPVAETVEADEAGEADEVGWP
jgi:hypothetical protein